MASVPEARMREREADHRAIAIAFLASIALHLLLLAAWPTLRDPSKRAEFSPGPFIARLVALAPAVPLDSTPSPAGKASSPEPDAVPAPRREEAPKPAAEPTRASEPLPLSDVKPKPSPSVTFEPAAPELASPAVSATPEMPVVRVERAEPVGPTPRIAPPATAPEASPSAQPFASPGIARRSPESAPTAAPAPPREVSSPAAPDAATLAQYRLALIDAARRYKRYPRAALDNNWEGRAEVRVEIRPDGALATLALRASTGYEVLDREALDMIRQAKAQTPVPVGLRGRELTIEIPVIFSLRDPGA